MQAEQAALLDNHQLGLTEIQHAAGPGAGFDTLTVFESYPVEREALARTAERTGVELVGANGLDATHYPLTVVARIAADRLALSLKYLPELLDPARVEAIATRLAHVLRAVVTDPELPVGRVDLLDAAERAVLVPVRGRPVGRCGVCRRFFAAAAARDPDAAALRCGGVEMTYRELEEGSNRLARVLIEHGAGPEGFVAVAVARSVASVLAVWAVAKTGAGFVPVDPDYPGERIGHMLTDCGAVVGVTVTAHRGALPDTVAWLDLHDPAVVVIMIATTPTPPTISATLESAIITMKKPAVILLNASRIRSWVTIAKLLARRAGARARSGSPRSPGPGPRASSPVGGDHRDLHPAACS